MKSAHFDRIFFFFSFCTQKPINFPTACELNPKQSYQIDIKVWHFYVNDFWDVLFSIVFRQNTFNLQWTISKYAVSFISFSHCQPLETQIVRNGVHFEAIFRCYTLPYIIHSIKSVTIDVSTFWWCWSSFPLSLRYMHSMSLKILQLWKRKKTCSH